MSEPMDHAEISEQLRALALGKLSLDQAAHVRSHLAGCGACTTEYRALELLLGLPVEEPSEIESRRLHARVLEALNPFEQAAAPVASSRPSPIRTRVAQALGAAALLALVGGIGYLATNFSGDGDGAADLAGGADAESEAMADIGFELEFRRPQGNTVGGALGKSGGEPEAPESGTEDLTLEQNDEAEGDTDGGSAAGGAGAEEAGTFGTGTGGGALRPLYVRGAGILRDRTLTLVGRYGLPLVLFPNVYTPADAMELQTDFLRQLANAAESSARSERVLECGSAVLARPQPVLPALATFGRLDNKMTLVMAFAWTDTPDGRLDQFMVWSWPQGDCDALPGYRAGYINR